LKREEARLFFLFFELRKKTLQSLKNKVRNNKCQSVFFVVVAIQKEKIHPGLFSFRIATAEKLRLTFGV
jgi:hypothetical protein